MQLVKIKFCELHNLEKNENPLICRIGGYFREDFIFTYFHGLLATAKI